MLTSGKVRATPPRLSTNKDSEIPSDWMLKSPKNSILDIFEINFLVRFQDFLHFWSLFFKKVGKTVKNVNFADDPSPDIYYLFFGKKWKCFEYRSLNLLFLMDYLEIHLRSKGFLEKRKNEKKSWTISPKLTIVLDSIDWTFCPKNRHVKKRF